MEHNILNSNNQIEGQPETVNSSFVVPHGGGQDSGPEGLGGATAKFKLKRKHAKWIVIIVIILVLAGFTYAVRDWFIAATVDGRVISRLAVVRELEKHGGQETLDLLINQQLIDNQAKKQNITVSNEEIDQVIKEYEKIYSGPEGNLDDTLKAQNLTRANLIEQIIIQKKVEKLLAEKTAVSEDDVKQFVEENKVPMEAGKEEEIKQQIRDELKQQKVASQTEQLLQDLRGKAKINTFIQY